MTPYDAARTHLAAGQPREAFGALRPALAYPCTLGDAEFAAGITLLAEAVEAIAGPKLAGRVRAVGDAPSDVDALYAAAYDLYEEELHDLAAGLLGRACVVAPGTARLVSELSSNLEALMLNGEAARHLRESGVAERDLMCRYLLGFNALLSGDLDEPRTLLPGLQASDDASIQALAATLADMLARADALAGVTPLDDSDLAGWHLVVNGGLLLHLSPHGFDDGMNGRYAYVGDSYGLLREGVERLAAVLPAAGHAPARVLAAPDRSSEILATAVARHLELPLVPWSDATDRSGLVVAYDLDRVGDAEVLKALRDHAPDQLLFVHAACWTNPFPFTPDVTTFLYQRCATPWSGDALRVDPETQQVAPVAPDDAPAGEIADRILTAEIVDASVNSVATLTSLLDAVRRAEGTAAAGAFRTHGQRARQRAGLPVRSNRFA